MAAITQRVDNFLGGVSQQIDELKLPGQVRACVNGYTEPTFGLIKRPGAAFLAELKDTAGDHIIPGELDDAELFTIFRDNNEKYLVAIAGGKTPSSGNEIKVWSLTDGAAKTVNYTGAAKDYLTGGKGVYDVLTINDYTFITNKGVTVTTIAAPSYTYGVVATLKLVEVNYGFVYSVTIGGSTVTYTTVEAEPAPATPPIATVFLNADTILDALKVAIDGLAAGYTVTKIGTTLEITKATAFTISAKAGAGQDGLEVYQDSVENLADLATKTIHNRVVKVSNSVQVEDDYYLKFIATDGVSGDGYWEETLKPDISTGLTADTMPHQLVRNIDGTFTLAAATWEPRLVGDDLSNDHPSFVDNTINQLFFHNNRLGFLTGESVSMSQSGDYFNFYHNTALTIIASDPVDVNASSIKPAVLQAVIPVAQGLLLFSRNQQFLMSGTDSIISSGNASIKTVSNYENDISNNPVDMGTTVAFLSKTPSYSRVFEMQTRGQDEAPIVVDISSIVPEWIPSSVNRMVSSPANSLLVLADSTSRVLHIFRYYFDGEKRFQQAWFRWELPGKVEDVAIDEDVCYVTTKQERSYVISKISLIQSPVTATFLTADGSRVDPRLDIWFTPTTITYDAGNDYTRIDLDFLHDSNRTLKVVTANPADVTPSYSNSGQIYDCTVVDDSGQWYARVDGYDLTGEDMVVGYTYDYSVELPRFYYRSNEGRDTDYTAYLTVARAKFQMGLGGEVNFIVNSRGRDAWTLTAGVNDADYYLANDIPFNATSLFTVPIYQRSTNFTMSVKSDSPFPVSLVSMMWEGNYSPRFYSRR